jgi:peptide/nickel transport system substrate-binding protein
MLRHLPVLSLLFTSAFGPCAKAVERPIVIGWDSAPRAFDPRFAVDANSQYLENLVHCALVEFDENGKTVPALASKWDWTKPTELVLELRQDAQFANGSKVTPDDVKATYESFKDLNPPSPRQGAFKDITAIAVKDNSVTFQLAKPDSTFVTNLVVGILPKSLAGKTQLTTASEIVGCGAFEIAKEAVGSIQLKRNAKYSLGPKATAAEVEIKIVKDEMTRFAKLRANEVDIVQNSISRDKLGDIGKKYPNLKVYKRPGLNVTYLGFNMRDKTVGQIAVRQAISQAINREAIIKFILNGYASAATGMLPPADPFFEAQLPALKYDPAAASKALDDAGLKDPDGKGPKPRIELSYKTTTDATRVTIAKAIASDLAKVGIKVNVESLEWGRFKEDVEKGNVQMWSLSWIGFKDPDILHFAFATDSFPPNGGNRGWYSNAELDKILTAARAEVDASKRREMYSNAQKLIATELPYVFLWHEDMVAVVNSKLDGFKVFADGRLASLRETSKK